jgi:hypothetical protein
LTFGVDVERRSCSNFEVKDIIDAFAKAVPPPHKVHLGRPDRTILVQLVRNVCAVAVAPRYKELCKYNVQVSSGGRDALGLRGSGEGWGLGLGSQGGFGPRAPGVLFQGSQPPPGLSAVPRVTDTSLVRPHAAQASVLMSVRAGLCADGASNRLAPLPLTRPP